MSNYAVNVMINSLPKNYFNAGLTKEQKRNLARKAFFPSGMPNFTGINNNNNNNNNLSRKRKQAINKIAKNLKSSVAGIVNNTRRSALVNKLYGPKFRVPSVTYKTPSGPSNIFPEVSDPFGYNSNASYANNPQTLNLHTGIVEPAVDYQSSVPKYIKKGPRTILNPKWVSQNSVPTGPQNLMGRQGPTMEWNRFGPRSRRKTRKEHRMN